MYKFTIKSKNRPPFQVEAESYHKMDVIKSMILKQTKIPLEQQRLEYLDSNNNKIVLKDDMYVENTFLQDTDNVLTLKNLGKQISYRNLFYIEYAGPLLLWVLFFLIFIRSVNSYYFTVFLLVVFHYVKRLLESKFVHIFSNDTAPLIPSFKNFIFYWFVFGLLVPLEIYCFRYEKYSKQSLPNGMFDSILIVLFIVFELGNLYCHIVLRNLRINPDGSLNKERKIPKGLFFDLVVCPNYSFEILAWLTFVYLSGSYFALLFIAAGGSIMYIWAQGKKSKLIKIAQDDQEKSKLKKKSVIFPPCL